MSDLRTKTSKERCYICKDDPAAKPFCSRCGTGTESPSATKKRVDDSLPAVLRRRYKYLKAEGYNEEFCRAIKRAAEALEKTPTPETNEEPSVMGGAFHPAPMPTSLDAIEAHVRQIQQICDASNLDPTQWLNDYAAQGETAPDLNVSECCPSWLSGKHQFIENSWTRCACGAQKASKQRELTLHDFGYAPGNYSIKCLDCGQEALWCDKRASRCETCAKQALAENRKGLSESENV